MATLIAREPHIAEALQHRRWHRFEIGSRSLFLHHEPLPRLQEELELPHISRGCETARVSLGREPGANVSDGNGSYSQFIQISNPSVLGRHRD